MERDEHANVLNSRFGTQFGALPTSAIDERKANERKSTMTPKQRARSGRERTETLNLRTTKELIALLEAAVARAGNGATKTEIVERGIRAIAAELGVLGG